jgi:hypothetical protein
VPDRIGEGDEIHRIAPGGRPAGGKTDLPTPAGDELRQAMPGGVLEVALLEGLDLNEDDTAEVFLAERRIGDVDGLAARFVERQQDRPRRKRSSVVQKRFHVRRADRMEAGVGELGDLTAEGIRRDRHRIPLAHPREAEREEGLPLLLDRGARSVAAALREERRTPNHQRRSTGDGDPPIEVPPVRDRLRRRKVSAARLRLHAANECPSGCRARSRSHRASARRGRTCSSR